jgi:hypothetical protein
MDVAAQVQCVPFRFVLFVFITKAFWFSITAMSRDHGDLGDSFSLLHAFFS